MTEDGWQHEHRYRVAQLLGRPLLSSEEVHHRNGDRTDNTTNGPLVEFRSGNLELWTTSQPKGQRVEDKVEWAVELLKLYRPDLLADPVTT
jgi:hypothetical protein